MVLVLGYCFYPIPVAVKKHNFVALQSFQQQVDSLKEISAKQRKIYRIQPFNPNFISDHKGYMLGFSSEELDRLYAYRKEGKWIRSITDFKKVTKISDSLLTIVAPLFKFPDWTKNKTTTRKYKKKVFPIKSYAQKADLNTVSVEQLKKSVGLPDFIAIKIIKYRNRIGGFVNDIQLGDLNLYEYQKNKTLSMFTVKTSKKIKRVNINKASVEELIEVPYIDFETALDIRDYIDHNGQVSSFDELGKIKSFSLENKDKIALYLTIK
ncbi:ComEA family DNA-binding protein [Aquimarina longa]|uniref:ComEA family DNA-binding protein n=1 Tax=Aquimarina longa TaxID=1080221 RepID=UPI000780323B|nr:helix-hairpin-helix domain-containing protein [Aquimarina longa]